MEKDKNFEWIKDKLNKGKEELVKITKISKIKIEIATKKKKIDEKLKNLGLKVYQMSKEGELQPEAIELDLEKIKELENSVVELERQITELKAKGFEEEEEPNITKGVDTFETDEVIAKKMEETVEVNAQESTFDDEDKEKGK